MKNIKKTFAVLLVLATCFSFTACGTAAAAPTAELSVTSGEEKNPSMKDYTDDLQGLTDYFKDSELISGDPVSMEAGVIGAVAGDKYSYKYSGNAITCELYEFNTDELDDTAKTVLDSVKEKGEFTVLADKLVKAQISDSGKFIMIYTNTSNDDAQKAFSSRISDKFKTFAGGASASSSAESADSEGEVAESSK